MGLKSGSKSGKGVKQGSGKLGIGKSAPQSSSKQIDSDDEPDNDTSVIRPSIEISVSGVPQLVQAYQAATEELKTILARECDIIYECRVCRNLFRSVANLMAHKRVYCKTTYSFTKHTLNRNHLVDDYTVLIQPEPVPSNSQDKQNWTTSDKVPGCSSEDDSAKPQIVTTTSRILHSHPKKGLREIVDQLARKSHESISDSKEAKYTSATKLYETVSASILARTDERREHSFHLENIETTKVGMFQTKLAPSSSAEKEDLMKAQVSELQLMATQSEALLGPDGQIMLNGLSPLSLESNTLDRISDKNTGLNDDRTSKDEHVCPDCNVKFSTRKTLNHHMKSLHVTFRLCYPCPCCKSTFVNPWSVYRHLYKVHRKTAAQVRRMRPQIQKKAFKKEIHNEIPSVETNVKNDALKELQRLDQENQAWMDNFEEDLELQRCGGCGRRFERRAALNSHSQICQKRIAARNNVKTVRNLPSTSSSEKTVKTSQSDDQNLEADAYRKPSGTNKTADSVNAVGSSRSHQNAVSNWAEQSKKEVREKKIEIQIRKDYCKMSSASSVVALSNDTQSEPDSRPPSPIADDDDDDCYVDMRDWESMTEMEEETKEESESEYPLFQDTQVKNILSKETVKEGGEEEEEDGDNRNSPVCVSESGIEYSSSVRHNTFLRKYESKKNDFCAIDNAENIRKRRASADENCSSGTFEGGDDMVKRRRQSLQNETSNVVEDSNNALSSKNKKLEQYHPVMEARMKKLINLRRLQCLPCQKKFIKLTNLRRHVAVHIGWCRYRCMLCPFKCFSKYDCVDHVCKIHLKGTQRSKAAAMVEYIEEQESEATVSPEQFEETHKNSELMGNVKESTKTLVTEETTETMMIEDTSETLAVEDDHVPLSVQMNSLNLEDIRNIVGVTSYSDNVIKSEPIIEQCAESQSRQEDIPSPSDCTSPASATKDEDPVGFTILNVRSVDIEDFSKKEENEAEEVATTKEEQQITVDVSPPHSEPSDDEQNTEGTSSSDSQHLSGNSGDLQESLENDHSETQEGNDDTESSNTDLRYAEVDSIDEQSNSSKNIEADKSHHLPDFPNDESQRGESNRSCDIPTHKEETVPLSPHYDEHESDHRPELVTDKETDGSVGEAENINEKQYMPTECDIQLHTNEVASLSEEIAEGQENCTVKREPEDTLEEQEDSPDEENRDGNHYADDNAHADDDEAAEEKSSLEDAEPPENYPDAEEEQNALRKMVMEVIFGSGGNSGSDPDANQNLISVSMNGNVFDGESSDSRSSRASSSSEPDVVVIENFTNNHLTSTSSKVVKSKVDLEHSSGVEGERRERPVRNRVKVEKEDFIYDFTDSYLKKEESAKGSNRKKQVDLSKEAVKLETPVAHNSGLYKGVPKLMLVRTDSAERGNRCVSGSLKGSWSSSVYATAPEFASSKNYVASSSQMCSTSRKVPRTYDVKQ